MEHRVQCVLHAVHKNLSAGMLSGVIPAPSEGNYKIPEVSRAEDRMVAGEPIEYDVPSWVGKHSAFAPNLWYNSLEEPTVKTHSKRYCG